MQSYQNFFNSFLIDIIGINKKYDAYNINFECLKQSIDYFESKQGKFSDFGLMYISKLARACEIISIE